MFVGIFTSYHVSNVIYKHILHPLSYLIQLSFLKSSACKIFAVIFSFMTCHRVCNQINTTGVTSEAGTVHPSGASEFTLGFQWGSCYSIFSFLCMFCRSLFFLFLLTIALSVLLRYKDSDYPLVSFKVIQFLMIFCGTLVHQSTVNHNNS